MPRATKTSRIRLRSVRLQLAERECTAAEQARDAAHKRVTAAFIELGRALLVEQIGSALRSGRGWK